MSQALIVRNDSALTIAFTEQAVALKSSALEKAALIGRVTDAESQAVAVDAQKDIATLLNTVEKARKAAKEPVLDFGRHIDQQAKDFVEEIKAEELRISQLVSDFQQVEQAKAKAAQQAENERLTKLERERAAELAKAKDMDAIDQVQARFNERAKVEALPVEAPARANGQRIREEWEITVTDLWTLARAHPSCVTISPRLTEIKDLLDAGVKVAGVTAKKVVKASVTAGRTLKAIDVQTV